MVACMAVMARETWTDERLDDLNVRVENGFGEVKQEVRDLRAETKSELEAARAGTKGEFRELRAEMNSRFNGIDSRFDAMQRTLVISFAGLAGSIVASAIGALLVTRL